MSDDYYYSGQYAMEQDMAQEEAEAQERECVSKRIAALEAENKRLQKELRYSEMAARAEARRVDELKAENERLLAAFDSVVFAFKQSLFSVVPKKKSAEAEAIWHQIEKTVQMMKKAK